MKLVYPVDTGRKLNVHKTFRRHPGRPVRESLPYKNFTKPSLIAKLNELNFKNRVWYYDNIMIVLKNLPDLT